MSGSTANDAIEMKSNSTMGKPKPKWDNKHLILFLGWRRGEEERERVLSSSYCQWSAFSIYIRTAGGIRMIRLHINKVDAAASAPSCCWAAEQLEIIKYLIVLQWMEEIDFCFSGLGTYAREMNVLCTLIRCLIVSYASITYTMSWQLSNASLWWESFVRVWCHCVQLCCDSNIDGDIPFGSKDIETFS